MGVAPIAVPQSLAYVLNTAGDKSDVDFDYLVQTAARESSLNPEAKAPNSSAVGLFQFLDSTWLQVMKEEGPRLGYQNYANAITRNADGDYTIKDKGVRAEVLKLREDPQVAADMAAAFTRSNGAYLEAKFGRMPSPGELYIAHFLGPQGAEKMFKAGLNDPDQVAAKLFPRQARANQQIFYADGHARTIREVYQALVAKHAGASPSLANGDPKFVAQQMASTPQAETPGRWSDDVLPSRFSRDDLSFTALFATEAPSSTVRPLIATDAIQSLLGPDAAAPPGQCLRRSDVRSRARTARPRLRAPAVAAAAGSDGYGCGPRPSSPRPRSRHHRHRTQAARADDPHRNRQQRLPHPAHRPGIAGYRFANKHGEPFLKRCRVRSPRSAESVMVAYQDFVALSQSGDSEERGQAAHLAAQAYLKHTGPADEHAALYAALIGFLDDPSVRVRAALAYGLLHAADAPRPILLALLQDSEVISRAVAQYSPGADRCRSDRPHPQMRSGAC